MVFDVPKVPLTSADTNALLSLSLEVLIFLA